MLSDEARRTVSTEELIDHVDWSRTDLGARAEWSEGLRSAVGICLRSRFPMIVFYGPELVLIYNDAYVPILGDKHPRALGQRARDCFPEIWGSVGPMLERVLATGEATRAENFMLRIVRNGRAEERYFTLACSAIDQGGRAAGVSCTVAETTAIVLRERNAREPAAEHELAGVESTALDAGALVAPAPRAERAAKILVADADRELQGSLARTLRPRYDVTTVDNGLEALEALHAGDFDLIVSDAMMPVLDGFGLLKAVRANPRLAPIPFVMLAARPGEASTVHGLAGGADDYLVEPFSNDELLARVAAHLNSASIRQRAFREVKASEERFRALTASMPHIVVETDASGEITFLSEAYVRFTGRRLEDSYGSRWSGAIHADDLPRIAERWRDAVARGATFNESLRMRRHDGKFRWQTANFSPRRTSDGRVVAFTGTITDVHEQYAVAREREFLSEASRLLAGSLDLSTTLQSIVRLAVPAFADWCKLDLVDDDGGRRTAAIAHVDAEVNTLAQRLVGKLHVERALPAGSAFAIRGATSTIVDDVGRAIDDFTDDPVRLDIYRRLGLGSAIFVPLVAGEETLGAIAFTYGPSQRRHDAEDLPTLEEFGRRAGLAIHNARRFEREHRVAESFQEASLPNDLPRVEGVRFDAVYSPAGDGARIGGDWYDAVRLFDGRVVVSIGDVTGNGLGAAVTMGNVRHIIRGIAQVHPDPALMLDAADRALRLEYPDRYVTAFVGVYDPIAETFAFASAGHPPAMLRLPDASTALLSDGGLPLGLRQYGQRRHGSSIPLPPGSRIVLYTDGLTEHRREPRADEDRLRGLIADGAAFAQPRPARALLDAMLDGDTARDDVAVLVLDIGTDPKSSREQRWRLDAKDADAAQGVRKAVADALRQRGASEESVAAGELVLGELLGNATRYAPGSVEVILDDDGEASVLHVLDDGPGFTHIPALPRDPYAESGRGLYIVSLLSEDFHVSRRPNRGSHARAVLSHYR